MSAVRWNIVVSPDMDQKGDLSRFIEEAVRSYLLECAVEQAKAVTADISEAHISNLIDEAIQWAREHHARHSILVEDHSWISNARWRSSH